MKFKITDTSGLSMKENSKYLKKAGFKVSSVRVNNMFDEYYIEISTLEELKTIAEVVRDPVSIHHLEDTLIIQDGYCKN